MKFKKFNAAFLAALSLATFFNLPTFAMKPSKQGGKSSDDEWNITLELGSSTESEDLKEESKEHSEKGKKCVSEKEKADIEEKKPKNPGSEKCSNQAKKHLAKKEKEIIDEEKREESVANERLDDNIANVIFTLGVEKKGVRNVKYYLEVAGSDHLIAMSFPETSFVRVTSEMQLAGIQPTHWVAEQGDIGTQVPGNYARFHNFPGVYIENEAISSEYVPKIMVGQNPSPSRIKLVSIKECENKVFYRIQPAVPRPVANMPGTHGPRPSVGQQPAANIPGQRPTPIAVTPAQAAALFRHFVVIRPHTASAYRSLDVDSSDVVEESEDSKDIR